MAWTEDPSNRLADQLRHRRAIMLQALNLSMTAMRQLNLGDEYLDNLQGLIDFNGHVGVAGKRTIKDALQYLKEKSLEPVRYLKPGESPIALPGMEGIKIFVLGPPEDKTLIKKSNPSKRHSEDI